MLKLLGNLIIAVIAIAVTAIVIATAIEIAISLPVVFLLFIIFIVFSIVMSFFKESDSSSYKTEIKNRSEKSDKLFESPKPEIENNFEKAVDEL